MRTISSNTDCVGQGGVRQRRTGPHGFESFRNAVGQGRARRAHRIVTASLVVASLAGSACVPPAPPPYDGPPLRTLADRVPLRIGATAEPRQLLESEYADTLAREFNSVTAENAMKWYSIQAERGVFNFSGADAVLEFAETNKMEVRGHALVWAQDSFTPDWVKSITDPAEMRDVIRTHIRTVLNRYRGRIHRWDVVNEPLDYLGFWESNSVFRRVLGPDWLVEVYRFAHEVDPTIELWLNEFDTDQLPWKHANLLAIARKLQAAGVPLHGVGLQTHRWFDFAPDRVGFERHMRDYADLGLEIAITELDVPTQAAISGHLERQAEAYRTIVESCLAISACGEVTMWGVTDRDSWLNNRNGNPARPQPLLFDESFTPKPAYRAVALAQAAGR